MLKDMVNKPYSHLDCCFQENLGHGDTISASNHDISLTCSQLKPLSPWEPLIFKPALKRLIKGGIG
jgi:hypothetical protein